MEVTLILNSYYIEHAIETLILMEDSLYFPS